MRALKTAAQPNYQVQRRLGCEHKRLDHYDYVDANLVVRDRTECLDCGYHVDKRVPHRP